MAEHKNYAATSSLPASRVYGNEGSDEASERESFFEVDMFRVIQTFASMSTGLAEFVKMNGRASKLIAGHAGCQSASKTTNTTIPHLIGDHG